MSELVSLIGKQKLEIEKLKCKLEKIKIIVNDLRSPHCAKCSQVLNEKGKCTGKCMYDYKKALLEIIEEK